MYELIKESKAAMDCVRAVLDHAAIDCSQMSVDEAIDKSRSLTARCKHDFDRPYKGHGTRICKKCGSLQTN